MIVPRCLCSDSLVLLENHLFKSCSEDRVEELIPIGSGIGGSPLPLPLCLSCLILLDVVAHNYCPHVGMIPNKTVGFHYDLYSQAAGTYVMFLSEKAILSRLIPDWIRVNKPSSL